MMKITPKHVCLLFSMIGTVGANPLFAQRDRIGAAISSGRTAILHGTMRPEAVAGNDRGRVEPSFPLIYMKLMVKPSAAQQSELDQLLEEQRNPASPSFHKWLTPEQFGDRFGLSSNDSGRMTAWLTARGFKIESVARGRMWVVFSGTAQQAETAFHTEIHLYSAGGEAHFANSTELSIPAELDGIVAGVRGLDDFRPKAPARNLASSHATPQALNGTHQLAPSDLATIYDIKPLYDTGIDGTGQKLAIIGQTKLVLSDIGYFRQSFGLPSNVPKVMLTGPDPGVTGDLIEADLDLEWSGAMAPNATLVYVYSNNVITSIEYAIDQNVAPVMSMSYGYCEPMFGPGIGVTYRLAAQQANAEGITIFVSSGDSGAAGCDGAGSPFATDGLAVNLFSSPPEITGVGGTQFDESGGTYWSVAGAPGGGAALSYIPEEAWNQSVDGGIVATGGGASILYTKPAWQAGIGVPNDGMRDVPDISLTASGHDGYLVGYSGTLIGLSGTSASSPSMAAIATLLNQYLLSTGAISQPGLGNINPNLYRMAQTTPNAFHDIVSGNNIVACFIGTFNCTKGSFGYSTGPGYDLATGLGSLDVNYFVTHWRDPAVASMTLTSSAAMINQSDSVTVTATVTAPTGTSPSGTVTFENLFATGAAPTPTPIGSIPVIAVGNTGTATITVYGGQLRIGNNNVVANYAGNAKVDAASASTPIAVALPTGNSDVVPSVARIVVQRPLPDAHGWSWVVGITLTEAAGTATTVTDFTVDGDSLASQLNTIFSKTAIAAKGSISGTFGFSNLTVPQTIVLGFSGMDAGGFKWTQQVPVNFMGTPLTALMSISSVATTSSDPTCLWAQQVTIQELTGIPVNLTSFTVGSQDLSSQIQQIFGTTRLAYYGQLQGTVCRTGATPPAPETYVVGGTDLELGSSISATTKVTYVASVRNPFVAPPQLTVGPNSVILSSDLSSGFVGVESATINVDPGGPNQQWSVSVFPNNALSTWLTVNPSSGTGPGEVLVYASPFVAELFTNNATLIFQSPGSTQQAVEVPVVYNFGLLNAAKIKGLANAASFGQTFAPGMLMTVVGTQLSLSTATIRSGPLPFFLNGVFATVNGVLAPIEYVSPSQINLQIPYETGAGTAVLGIDNNEEVVSFLFNVSVAAPGIFVGKSNALVPVSSAKGGDTVTLYMTGDGDTSVYIPDGSTPSTSTPLASLPKPRLPVSVTVGGLPATIEFIGITPGLVGETQVNFTVPEGLATGVQPVVVTVGGVSSQPANLTITQ